jgi:hypothetical protein
MSDYSTKQIIDYAMDDNGSQFRSALYASIHDKVTAHIEAKKQEIAENLLGLNDEQSEEQEELAIEEEVEELDEMDSYPHPDSKEGKDLLKMKKKNMVKHSKDLKMPSAKETLGNMSKSFDKMKTEEKLEEMDDHQKHFDNGYEHGRSSANDAGFKEKAKSIKKDMLADNPHKKGTPQHKAWHEGASEGHQDALDLDM